jgi:hypothetical protein
VDLTPSKNVNVVIHFPNVATDPPSSFRPAIWTM